MINFLNFLWAVHSILPNNELFSSGFAVTVPKVEAQIHGNAQPVVLQRHAQFIIFNLIFNIIKIIINYVIKIIKSIQSIIFNGICINYINNNSCIITKNFV